jgi:hypothetical protein
VSAEDVEVVRRFRDALNATEEESAVALHRLLATARARVVIRDSVTLDEIGTCTAPVPVEPGDLLVFEQGPPLRVTTVLWVPVGATVVPVLARPAVLPIAAR